MRSGSLITARLANEQGRQVFAVPGSPLDPRAEGANNLLREGASICLSAVDVIEALAPLRANGLAPRDLLARPAQSFAENDEPWLEAKGEAESTGLSSRTPENGAPSDIISLLGPSPTAIDELIRASGLAAHQVQMELLDLELSGRLVRHSNGQVSLL